MSGAWARAAGGGWQVGNGSFQLTVGRNGGGVPVLQSLSLAASASVDWAAAAVPLAPILEVAGVRYAVDAGNLSFLGGEAAGGALRLRWRLADGLEVEHLLEASADKPVWRSAVVVSNPTAKPVGGLTRFDAVSMSFCCSDGEPQAGYVLGWMEGPRIEAPGRPDAPWKYGGWIPKFLYGEGAAIPPAPAGGWAAPVYRLIQERLTKLPLRSGKRSTYVDQPWVTVLDEARAGGWFCGFEWSGTWKMDVEHHPLEHRVSLCAASDANVHELAPGGRLESPAAFVGLFAGGWDEAFNACRWYVDDEIIPKVKPAWPTSLHVYWFQNDLAKRTTEYLRREIDAAAAAGLETTYVETIWWAEGDEEGPGRDFSHGLGSFAENPTKWPMGFRTLSDYVHARGMQFGVWFEIERVDIRTANRLRNPWKPEWIVQQKGYPYRSWCQHAFMLCLGVPAAREWALENLLWAVKEYAIDYIMFDSNEWAVCDDPSHGHGPGDGEWAQTQGFYWVMRGLRRAHPDLMIMNSSGGSQRGDFGIARYSNCIHPHDNSLSSAKQRRFQHGTGCMYPNSYQANFLGAYVDEPTPEGYGFPLPPGRAISDERFEWRVLNRLQGYWSLGLEVSALPASQQRILAKATAFFKRTRACTHGDRWVLAGPRVLHEPVYEESDNWEATQYLARDRSIGTVHVFRCLSPQDTFTVKLRGLEPDRSYGIERYSGKPERARTGRELMEQGFSITLPRTRSADILLLAPR